MQVKNGHNRGRVRSLATGELKLLEQTAFRVIDQLSAILGYADVARERRKVRLTVCAELDKIQLAANRAIALVRSASSRLQETLAEDSRQAVSCRSTLVDKG